MARMGRVVLGVLLSLVFLLVLLRIAGAKVVSDATRKELRKPEVAKMIGNRSAATDLQCAPKGCVELGEIAAGSVRADQLAPRAVTQSKLAFDVPNRDELASEIAARQAGDAALGSAVVETQAGAARADEAVRASSEAAIAAEASARSAGDDDLSARLASAEDARRSGDQALEADLSARLARVDDARRSGDQTLDGEIKASEARSGAGLSALRRELANPVEVSTPVLAVNSNEIVDGAVTASKLGANSVTTVHILDGTIRAADIGDGQVTAEKLADNSVGSPKIVDGSITTADLGDRQVTTSKLATGSVTSLEILDGTVGAADLAPGSVGSDAVLDGSLSAADLASASVTTDEILDGTIQRNDLGFDPSRPAPQAPLILTLQPATLTNVEDAAGRWQHEGGTVLDQERIVGFYASTKRVTSGGTDAQNTAMLTMTIFFLGSAPPENLTVQGAHDFGSGNEVGSVSAASAQFTSRIDVGFRRSGDTVTIGDFASSSTASGTG